MALIAFLLSGTHCAWSQIELKAAPRETVELMCVVMSLTGVREYNPQHVWPEYKAFVDSWFAEYKDHSAVRFIVDVIFQEENIDMMAPAAIGVNSDIVDGRFVYRGNWYGWSEKVKKRFENEVDKFYRDTDFHEFWEKALAQAYPFAITPFNDVIVPKLNLGWIDRFVPVEESVVYGLTISYLVGEYNFGVTRKGVPNPVIGIWDMNTIVNPTEETLETYLPLTIHEYMHSYCNPLVDKYYTELAGPGEAIFPEIRERMTRASYPSWRIVLYESMVRASEIAYMHANGFSEESIERHITGNKNGGFHWVGELGALFIEYESARDRYPTLDSFMPRVVEFFKELALKTET